MSNLLENIRSHPEFAKIGKLLLLHVVEIDRGVSERAVEYVRQMGFESPILVVSDRNTYQALAEKLESILKKGGYQVVSAIFSDELLKPDEDAVKKVREGLTRAESCLAVGSGTLNDICKYASYLEEKPYAVFATAPSMNGYASANASLIIKEHRTSKQAKSPVGILMDVDVLAKAPKRLIRSGIGDMLCRSTVQGDWLLSHLLLDTPYQTLPFELIEEEEAVLLEESAEIVAGDRDGLSALSAALIKSGLGMWLAEGSYPASQSEHMVAHVMEMAFPKDSAKSYHGEQIAVTTLAMASIQERILQRDEAPIFKPKFDKSLMTAFLPENVVTECEKLWAKKPVSHQQVFALNKKLEQNWSDIQEKIARVQESREVLLHALNAAGLGLTPEAIGWHAQHFEWAVKVAHMTRDRFTFLDV